MSNWVGCAEREARSVRQLRSDAKHRNEVANEVAGRRGGLRDSVGLFVRGDFGLVFEGQGDVVQGV